MGISLSLNSTELLLDVVKPSALMVIKVALQMAVVMASIISRLLGPRYSASLKTKLQVKETIREKFAKVMKHSGAVFIGRSSAEDHQSATPSFVSCIRTSIMSAQWQDKLLSGYSQSTPNQSNKHRLQFNHW